MVRTKWERGRCSRLAVAGRGEQLAEGHRVVADVREDVAVAQHLLDQSLGDAE